MSKGWMLFDTISGNAVDVVLDPYIAEGWSRTIASESEFALIEFEYDMDEVNKKGYIYMSEDKFDDEGGKFVPDPDAEGPDEPADDTAEAQPSIEREDAATGRTGSGSPAAGESGGIGSAGNPG